MKTYTLNASENKLPIAQLYAVKSTESIPTIAAWIADMSLGELSAKDMAVFLQKFEQVPYQNEKYFLECTRSKKDRSVFRFTLYQRAKGFSIEELEDGEYFESLF